MNETQLSMYNDTATNKRDVIIIDSRFMPTEPIKKVTIKLDNNFLTLCEVKVYGKLNIKPLKQQFYLICVPPSLKSIFDGYFYYSCLNDLTF